MIDYNKDLTTLTPEELKDECIRLQSRLLSIDQLISDDSYCITFQTIGQYRTAILKSLRR